VTLSQVILQQSVCVSTLGWIHQHSSVADELLPDRLMPDLQLTGTLPTIIANNTVQQALKIRSNLVPPPPFFSPTSPDHDYPSNG